MNLNYYEDDCEYYTEIDKEIDLNKLKRLVIENQALSIESVKITPTEVIITLHNYYTVYSIAKLDEIATNLEVQELIRIIESAIKLENDEELPF